MYKIDKVRNPMDCVQTEIEETQKMLLGLIK